MYYISIYFILSAYLDEALFLSFIFISFIRINFCQLQVFDIFVKICMPKQVRITKNNPIQIFYIYIYTNLQKIVWLFCNRRSLIFFKCRLLPRCYKKVSTTKWLYFNKIPFQAKNKSTQMFLKQKFAKINPREIS